jgi:hypothetical protein
MEDDDDWQHAINGYRVTQDWHRYPASRAQIAALERRGYDVTGYEVSMGEANYVLNQPSPKQRKVLERRGLYWEGMTFDDAKTSMAKLARDEGW